MSTATVAPVAALLHPCRPQLSSGKRLSDGWPPQDNWTITEDSPDFLQAVVKTPLMQFRDDVQLVFDRQAGELQVRSSSRLGISDMGANRRRIESLRTHLASEAAAAAD